MGKAIANATNAAQGWRGNKKRKTNEKRNAERKAKKHRGNPY